MSRPLACAVLTRARVLLENPEDWAHRSVRTPDRYTPTAAIVRAAHQLMKDSPLAGRIAARPAMSFFVQEIEGGAVSAWNDAPERTHADVLAAFDRAIAACDNPPS